MENQERQQPPGLPSTRKIDAVIYTMTFLINLGRYLPWVELALGIVNSVYAFLNFFVFHSYVAGLINTLFAIGSFVFYAQLLPRRNVHRYQYRYAGRHRRGDKMAGRRADFPGVANEKKGGQASGSAEA
ncbi:MAG: hypothetical protein ABI361_04780 [Nitrososphaera sp.]